MVKNFWKGFWSVFDFSFLVDNRPRLSEKYKPKPFTWYHNGPWWEHPLYKDTWKDKKSRK